ncbi:hypothetical protein Bca4012_064128 [Brassica carinata]
MLTVNIDNPLEFTSFTPMTLFDASVSPPKREEIGKETGRTEEEDDEEKQEKKITDFLCSESGCVGSVFGVRV